MFYKADFGGPLIGNHELSLVLGSMPLAAEGLTTTPVTTPRMQAAADKSKDCEVLRPKLIGDWRATKTSSLRFP